MQDAQCVDAMRRRLHIPSTFTFSNSMRQVSSADAKPFG